MKSDKRLNGAAVEPFVSIFKMFGSGEHIIVDSFRHACYNTPAFRKKFAFFHRSLLLVTLRDMIRYRRHIR